jgi:hypothetical protein
MRTVSPAQWTLLMAEVFNSLQMWVNLHRQKPDNWSYWILQTYTGSKQQEERRDEKHFGFGTVFHQISPLWRSGHLNLLFFFIWSQWLLFKPRCLMKHSWNLKKNTGILKYCLINTSGSRRWELYTTNTKIHHWSRSCVSSSASLPHNILP